MKQINRLFYIAICFLFIGCDDDSFPVPPASVVADFTFTVDNDQFAPATATFSNQSIVPDDVNAVSYAWNFGDGTFSSEVNPSHTYTAPGRYTVTLAITSDRNFSQFESSVNVKDPDEVGTQIFFTDRNLGSIQLALINDRAPVNSTLAFDQAFSRPYGIAVDTEQEVLYIADLNAGEIHTSDLDGSNRSLWLSGLAGPAGLVLDQVNDYLYWTTDDGIQRTPLSDTDGSQVETIVTGQGDNPEGLSIDVTNGMIYWVTYDGGLWSADLGGAGASEIISSVLGAAVLVTNNKLYFHSFDGGHTLKMADLDGSNVTTIATGMDGDIYGLVYDSESDKIYYNDQRSGKVKRINLDGSGNEDWFTDTSLRIYGIALGIKIE